MCYPMSMLGTDFRSSARAVQVTFNISGPGVPFFYTRCFCTFILLWSSVHISTIHFPTKCPWHCRSPVGISQSTFLPMGVTVSTSLLPNSHPKSGQPSFSLWFDLQFYWFCYLFWARVSLPTPCWLEIAYPSSSCLSLQSASNPGIKGVYQGAGEMAQQLRALTALFQRSWVQFPATTWWLTTSTGVANDSSSVLMYSYKINTSSFFFFKGVCHLTHKWKASSFAILHSVRELMKPSLFSAIASGRAGKGDSVAGSFSVL